MPFQNLLLNFKIAIPEFRLCSCFARTSNERTWPLPPHSKRLSFTLSSFAPRSHVDAIEIWNLLSLYWVQLKFCSFERLNTTNQLHVFQNICYGDSDSLCVSISVKFYCFFFVYFVTDRWNKNLQIFTIWSDFNRYMLCRYYVFCYSLEDSFNVFDFAYVL